jgi:MFS superfamily sulfate permease-like transporter
MELGQLYQFVLMLILVGMIIGVGIVSLDRLQTSVVSGYTTSSETITQALGNSTLALASIPTSWLSLIVTIVILAIIVVLVVRSFAGISDQR